MCITEMKVSLKEMWNVSYKELLGGFSHFKKRPFYNNVTV